MVCSNGDTSPAASDSEFEGDEHHHLYFDVNRPIYRQRPVKVEHGGTVSKKEDIEALRQRLERLEASGKDEIEVKSDKYTQKVAVGEGLSVRDSVRDINSDTLADPKDAFGQKADYFSLVTPNTSSAHTTTPRMDALTGNPSNFDHNGHFDTTNVPTLFTSRSSSTTLSTRSTSRSPSWSQLDRALVQNDLLIYKTIESRRRRRLTIDQAHQQPENMRKLGIPVKLDVHIKIMINSRPLFDVDWDEKTSTIRARRFVLESYKHTYYSQLQNFMHQQCKDMWGKAKARVEEYSCSETESGADLGVNKALNTSRKEAWLDLESDRALLKLEEDVSVADMAVGRTIIAGNEAQEHKEGRYKEWYRRNVEMGVLASYCVEFTVDMVLNN